VEVFLYQLLALLKADKYNITLLSGKVGIIEVGTFLVLVSF